MYTPSFNQITGRALLLKAMQAYSFAILCGRQSESTPSLIASHLPLVVKDEGEHGVLEGHFARANSHWKSFAGHEILVVFPGPHSYVSPAHYTDPLSVPTWNYIAIHAYGTPSLIEDEAGKDAVLTSLMRVHEPAVAAAWHAMPESFRCSMLAEIVAFRIPIARIEGKFKLSQNRAPEERRNVQASQSTGTSDEQALAAWMARLQSPDG
jgi:transcriptional regulator